MPCRWLWVRVSAKSLWCTGLKSVDIGVISRGNVKKTAGSGFCTGIGYVLPSNQFFKQEQI
uniref:Uncharacterized protein n=1 Tax=Anguilla anguilla TaxID=7936 RepID=A0A0E9WFV0_ANGAN